ncbi:MAG: stress protein [Candidatus Cloacimonetes bacterium HGW-Cloacimonetes-3]|jgi:tellurite resistance protein TerA|nr:MAG: stress protein [Candidatus Cloacimonetes bacterium HGW-Cloacimonetes-3]
MAIELKKVTLENRGDSHRIVLSKESQTSTSEIIINLNWTQEVAKKGFFANLLNSSQGIDLDLGCFYELRSGEKMVIDGIQFAHNQGGPRERATKQGCLTRAPWIWHSGDDRSGAGDGENILVNPKGIKELKRIIVYCFIYDGVAKWMETNAVVTVKVPENPDIVVEMGKQNSTLKFCAIAEILLDATDSITVKKLLTFHTGHAECDKAYGWGLQWHAGSK